MTYRFTVGIALFAMIAVILLSLNLGSIPLSPQQVVATLFGQGTPRDALVLFEFRLPRILIAVLIGMGLAVSGVILQAVTENDLAEPGIIGINSGAGFGVITYLLLQKGAKMEQLTFMQSLSIPIAAIIGGLLAVGLTFFFASRKGLTPIRLILVGIAINAGFQALIILFEMRLDEYDLTSILVWLSGSIWVSNCRNLAAVVPWLLCLIPYVIYRARTLDVMKLGEQSAVGLGVQLQRERKQLAIVAVILAGVCVAVGGGVAFVGLMAPHIARRLVGVRHDRVIVMSMLVGALLVLVADTIGKNVSATTEISVGILIAILGAPYFIYLLIKTK